MTSGRGTAFARLRVARVDRLCDDAAAITLDVPADLAPSFAFRPGQSLTLRRVLDGSEVRRSYSICAPVGERPRVGVREVPGGLISRWLVHDVRAGDELDVLPPTGSFTPELDRPARHVLIAAGSGITPMLSIAASVLKDGESEVTLVYGNRRADTVMFADEIADLKDVYPTRLSLVHVLSREAQEVDLFSGRLDAARLRELLPRTCPLERVDHWWLCGPFGMVTDAMQVLREFDIPSQRIHRELFYVEDTAPPPARHVEVEGDGAEVTVILDGRASTATVPWDVAILDGVQRTRQDLPFACRGGVCGTCRARVVDGTVSMRRNFALEPEEVAAGFVLTCQALCESPSVTVDYDA